MNLIKDYENIITKIVLSKYLSFAKKKFVVFFIKVEFRVLIFCD